MADNSSRRGSAAGGMQEYIEETQAQRESLAWAAYSYAPEPIPRHLRLWHPPTGIAKIGSEAHAALQELEGDRSQQAEGSTSRSQASAGGAATGNAGRALSYAALSPRSSRPSSSQQQQSGGSLSRNIYPNAPVSPATRVQELELSPKKPDPSHLRPAADTDEARTPPASTSPLPPSPPPPTSEQTEAARQGLAPSFTFICLGVGGGPLESDCSCYLLKPGDSTWEEGAIVVEGGSFLGALAKVCGQPAGPPSLNARTGSVGGGVAMGAGEVDYGRRASNASVASSIGRKSICSSPSSLRRTAESEVEQLYDPPGPAFEGVAFPFDDPSLRAGLIGSFTRGFLISHAHLDHILGMVLGCAALPGKKSVWGLRPTLENVMQLFDGKIWPKLASWDDEEEGFSVYRLKSLRPERSTAILDERLSVLSFPLSHGLSPNEQPPAPPTDAGVIYASNTAGRGASLPQPASKRYSLPLSSHFNLLGLRSSTTATEPQLLSPFFGGGVVGGNANTTATATSTTRPSIVRSNSSFQAQLATRGEKLFFTSPFVPDEGHRLSRAEAGGRLSRTASHVRQPSYGIAPSERGSVATVSSSSFTRGSVAGPAPERLVEMQSSTTAPVSPASKTAALPDVLDDAAQDSREGSPRHSNFPSGAGNALMRMSDKMSARLGIGGQPLRKIGRRPRTAQGSEHTTERRQTTALIGSSGLSAQNESPSGASTPSSGGIGGGNDGETPRTPPAGEATAAPAAAAADTSPPALDSTAFFITNQRTGKDVLFFGDVEPDSISQYPRNMHVWRHAATRYVEGALNAIFLECSFPVSHAHPRADICLSHWQRMGRGSQPNHTQAAHPTQFLYGHLSVGHVFDEMKALAKCVLIERKKVETALQRKRILEAHKSQLARDAVGNALDPEAEEVLADHARRLSSLQVPDIPPSGNTAKRLSEEDLKGALSGLTLIIIHVKTALFPSFEAQQPPATTEAAGGEEESKEEMRRRSSGQSSSARTAASGESAPRRVDPRSMQQRILEELQETEAELQLGVRIEMAVQGQRIEC